MLKFCKSSRLVFCCWGRFYPYYIVNTCNKIISSYYVFLLFLSVVSIFHQFWILYKIFGVQLFWLSLFRIKIGFIPPFCDATTSRCNETTRGQRSDRTARGEGGGTTWGWGGGATRVDATTSRGKTTREQQSKRTTRKWYDKRRHNNQPVRWDNMRVPW